MKCYRDLQELQPLGGGWWLQLQITPCKLLSLRRFTSVSSTEGLPNCQLSGKHPAKLPTVDSLLAVVDLQGSDDK